LLDFMAEHIYPNEVRYYSEAARLAVERLSDCGGAEALARQAGLWNLFLSESRFGGRRSLESRVCTPLRDHGQFASRAGGLHCSAPDTGNMEVLLRYGTLEQQKRWLEPLLAGEIRSAFAMTEPLWLRRTRRTSRVRSLATARST